MAPNQLSSCVFCKRNEPHEKHLTLLEYTRIFGGMDDYANNTVLVQSASYTVAQSSAVKRIA